MAPFSKAPAIALLTAIVCPALPAREISFNEDVRPILSDRCFHCHGPDAENQKSDFRLDSFANATADLGGYEALVPGDLKGSELHHRIRSTDPDEMMPPPQSNRKLSDEERDILDAWIEQGAEYDEHWAFKTIPAEIPIPEAGEGWAKGPVDQFVAERREEAQLAPAAPSSDEKWFRRVAFDLTGLPPTLAELDAFLADRDRGAALDRLFDTDAHAERMANEWLDVARYSDTYGYQVDRDRFVWPWRDWVIRSFRENKPYNEFITEQVAGDLLPEATRDQILATTFSRLHPQKVEGGSVPEEFRIEYVADRTHTVGTAFLGLTMECCRCHDHKYDPISQKEYYGLSAFFANVDESGLYSYFTPSIPTPALDLPTEADEKALAEAETAVHEAGLVLRRSSYADKVPDGFKASPPADIAHISFDNRKGNSLPDTDPARKAASTTSRNKTVAGRFGDALHLTGDDAVKLAKGVGNFTRNQPFSISLWVKASKHRDRAVILRRSKAWTDAGSRGYELLLEDGRPSAALIHFWPGNALRVRAKDPLPVGEWHQLCLTYDGSSRAARLQLYLDGQPLATEIVRDHLTREITGGGDDFLALGERMRDRGFKDGLVDELRVFDRELSRPEVRMVFDPATKLSEEESLGIYVATQDKTFLEDLSTLQKAYAQRSAVQKRIPQIMVMKELPEPRENYLLERGAYDARGEPVSATTPAALPPLPEDAPANRLGLARWLTSETQPLTARVTVNRYWQMLFGTGLVRTSEDFGSQGSPPTHPELLDWLSRDFMESGWDVRHLLRQILLSATYAQSTVADPSVREVDPENRLLARFPTRRLTAEMIRDNALATSGLLVPRIGGASVKPYELAHSFKPAKPGTGEQLYRRSLYTYWKRTGPAPVMMTLNASKRDVCRVRREVTNSPLQALVLLNDPQIIEAARVLATRLAGEHEGSDFLAEAFRLLTSRPPSAREIEVLTNLYREQLASFEADPAAAEAFLQTGQAKPKSEQPVPRLAAATVVVNAIMNLDEAIYLR